jgi:hypothetical protein
MTTVEEDIKAWADKHLLDEQEEKKANPFFDYVTIPISEYRKLIKKVERVKVQKRQLKELADLQKDAGNYRSWWKEEEAKREGLEKQLAQAKEVINQYKADYEKKLGISELQKEKEVQNG